ncbi:MAG: glycosyltransferase [Planctomycetota bacterium]
MKIALIIPTMDRGGAEKQVVLLACGLHQRGHDVRVLLLTRDGPRSETLRRHGVIVEVIGKRFKGDVTALWRLRRSLQGFQPDVVHTFLFAANSFGRLAAVMAKVPVVMASERCIDVWKQSWQFWIDRRLQSVSHAITTNSIGVVDFLIEHGIEQDKIKIIHNGIDPVRCGDGDARDVISRADAAAQLNVDQSRVWLVAVGRLWPQKRVRDLVWAAELLGTLRENTTLIVIGDGPQRDELLRHRDAVSRVDYTRFVGWRDNVRALLPHAAAFWLASSEEGQSNALIEAMQMGVPVIASDIPGNRELIDDGKTGWLFPLGDEAALARVTNMILDDPETSQRVASAAQQRINADFSVDEMVQRHVDLYVSALQRSGETS